MYNSKLIQFTIKVHFARDFVGPATIKHVVARSLPLLGPKGPISRTILVIYTGFASLNKIFLLSLSRLSAIKCLSQVNLSLSISLPRLKLLSQVNLSPSLSLIHTDYIVYVCMYVILLID